MELGRWHDLYGWRGLSGIHSELSLGIQSRVQTATDIPLQVSRGQLSAVLDQRRRLSWNAVACVAIYSSLCVLRRRGVRTPPWVDPGVSEAEVEAVVGLGKWFVKGNKV